MPSVDTLRVQGFLSNYARGLQPPLTGADDAQANCIVRAAPLVAAWAGSSDLMHAVQHATRVRWACYGVGAFCLQQLTWPCQAASLAPPLAHPHTVQSTRTPSANRACTLSMPHTRAHTGDPEQHASMRVGVHSCGNS